MIDVVGLGVSGLGNQPAYIYKADLVNRPDITIGTKLLARENRRDASGKVNHYDIEAKVLSTDGTIQIIEGEKNWEKFEKNIVGKDFANVGHETDPKYQNIMKLKPGINAGIHLIEGSTGKFDYDNKKPSTILGYVPQGYDSDFPDFSGQAIATKNILIKNNSDNYLKMHKNKFDMQIQNFSVKSNNLHLDSKKKYFAVGEPDNEELSYSKGTGIFAGYDNEGYKFRVGNPSGQRFDYSSKTVSMFDSKNKRVFELSPTKSSIKNLMIDGDLIIDENGSIRSINAGKGGNGLLANKNQFSAFATVGGVKGTRTLHLPFDGKGTPEFYSGKLREFDIELYTSGIIRTSAKVGAESNGTAGTLINNTGIYSCSDNQSLANAFYKVNPLVKKYHVGDNDSYIRYDGNSKKVRVAGDFEVKGGSLRVELDEKARKIDLGTLAGLNQVSISNLDPVLIENGKIKATYIQTSAIEISHAKVTGLGSLATKNSLTASDVGADPAGTATGLFANLDSKKQEAIVRGRTLIVNGYIDTYFIKAGSISASKINVTDLFAQNITASGTISGMNIKTSDGNNRVEMDNSGVLKFYKNNVLGGAIAPFGTQGFGGIDINMGAGAIAGNSGSRGYNLNSFDLSFRDAQGSLSARIYSQGRIDAKEFRNLNQMASIDPDGNIIGVNFRTANNIGKSGTFLDKNGNTITVDNGLIVGGLS